MENRYGILRHKQQEKADAVMHEYVFFAFSESQFEEGMKKIGAKFTSELYRLGDSGGFYKKTDAPKIRQLFSDLDAETKEAFRTGGAEFVKEAFLYEMGNHEYGLTYDLEPVLDSLGLTMEEVLSIPYMADGLKMAKESFRDCMEVKE